MAGHAYGRRGSAISPKSLTRQIFTVKDEQLGIRTHTRPSGHRLPFPRFSLFAAIESTAQKLGDIHRQGAAISTLLALANDLDDDTFRATAFNRSRELRLQTGVVRQRQATDQLESIARKHADSSLLAKALCCRARAEIALGRPASAVLTLQSIDALDGLDR